MTPEELAALSACYRCVPDQRAAILFLLARIADVTIEEIIAGSACFRCLSDFQAAQLFLLNTIATNGTGGGGGSGEVLCGAVPPVAAPATSCALYYDTVSTALYYWDGAAWQLKV